MLSFSAFVREALRWFLGLARLFSFFFFLGGGRGARPYPKIASVLGYIPKYTTGQTREELQWIETIDGVGRWSRSNIRPEATNISPMPSTPELRKDQASSTEHIHRSYV